MSEARPIAQGILVDSIVKTLGSVSRFSASNYQSELSLGILAAFAETEYAQCCERATQVAVDLNGHFPASQIVLIWISLCVFDLF